MFTSVFMLMIYRMVLVSGQPPQDCEEYNRYTDKPSITLQSPSENTLLDIDMITTNDPSCWERPALSGNFYCFYRGLTSIPKSLPPRTRCIIFSGNNLTKLKDDDVKYLVNIQILILDDNPLAYIEGDFSQLPLNVLSIQGTRLNGLFPTSLPVLKYYAQSNAVVGNLYNNSLTTISRNLTYLSLTNCSISESGVETFQALPNLEVLDVSSNNFTTVPINLPPTLKELKLLNTFDIAEINETNLFGLNNLQNLSICARTMDSRTLGVTSTPNLLQLKLQACHVRSNALSGVSKVNDFVVYGSFCDDRKLHLEPYAFSNLTDLQTFTMDRISIATIPSGLFHGATKLESLFIEFDNLDEVQVDAFDGLPSLKTLRLTNNYIPVNKSVILSDNFLGQDLPSLTLLDLSDFRIEHLKEGTFQVAPNILRLYMGYNMMTSMTPLVFWGLGNLQYISLYNNPWLCDFNLRWLKNLADTKPGFFYGGNKLQCDQPQNLHGKYFDQLKLSDFVC